MVTVIAVAIGLPTIIAFQLNKKNANKTLKMAEVTTDLGITGQQLATYDQLLKEMKDSREELKKEIQELKAQVTEFRERVRSLEDADDAKADEIDSTNAKLEILRNLFNSVTDRIGVPLTPEEIAIFESTKPMSRHVRNTSDRD